MGLFGAIGRETRGAFRSLGYDLRRSRRFRRAGAIAVVAVAGGMIATGALLREPVPGLQDLADEGADITGGWFGLGADTTGQDAESAEATPSQSTSSATEHTEPEGEASDSAPARDTRDGHLGEAPGLVPVGGGESPGPVEEGSPTPTQEPTEEPSETPTAEEPTETPTEEPTTAEPATDEPTPSASLPTSNGPSPDPTESTAEASALQAPRHPAAPVPRKRHID